MSNDKNQKSAPSAADLLASLETAPAEVSTGGKKEESEASLLKTLILLMMRKEQSELIRSEQDAESRKRKDASARQQSELLVQETIGKRAVCKHRKGNYIKGQMSNVDYAVYMHTFVDKSQYIKCQICGMKWRPGDTAEFLLVGGKKIGNYTHIGWEDAAPGKLSAVAMFEQSSNKASSSEIPLVEPKKPAVPIDAETGAAVEIQL